MSEKRFPDVPGGYPFPQLEQEVLAEWRSRSIFEKTLEKPSPEGEFVFFEGPPTANNVPHVGHVVTRVVKDLFPRYRTMRGYHVARKAGWDTHGLPVEIEVEKRLGFTGKQQIEAYGIAEFNQACLESVHTYERQWRAMTERVGYWLDLDHAYFTYTNDLHRVGLVGARASCATRGPLDEGYKIQPYCARCGTTLSSHEVAQNYKDADDPSDLDALPGPAGPVDPDGDCGRRRSWDDSREPVPGRLDHHALDDPRPRGPRGPPRPGLPRGRAPRQAGRAVPHRRRARHSRSPWSIEEDGKRRQIDLREQPALARFRGRDLEGSSTTGSSGRLPRSSGRCRPRQVVPGRLRDGHRDGTGLVHTAPPFGEDDYRTGQPLRPAADPVRRRRGQDRASRRSEPSPACGSRTPTPRSSRTSRAAACSSTPSATATATPSAGAATGRSSTTPPRAGSSARRSRRQELVDKNKEIDWHPRAHRRGALRQLAGERGRLGAVAQALLGHAAAHLALRRVRRTRRRSAPTTSCSPRPGRERPADLYDPRAVRSAPAVHRRGHLALPEVRASGTMRRVEEVIDAWFDSGAMPFAQHHYPFENRELIDGRRQFPADFISEAVDQTRGWFYTLHVLGVLLFDSVAYETCIVLGHVNDEQGRKMSKRLGNVVEPMAGDRGDRAPTRCAGTSASTTRSCRRASRPGWCARRRRGSCCRCGTRCRSSPSTPTWTAGGPPRQSASNPRSKSGRPSTAGSSCGSTG